MTDEHLMKAAQDLIYLLSCAVNNTKPDSERCAAMEPEDLYGLAEYHGVASAAAHALERTAELPRSFDQAKKKAIRKLALFDIERAKILDALEQSGVWYMPLKGIILKDLYPKTAMREMNDNDILCDESKAEAVRDILEELGYNCDLYGMYHHDVYSKPPTLEFEMHRALFREDTSPLLSNYYSGIKDRLLPDDGKRFGCHMCDADFYIYLLCHMFKHYSNAGTGLRSLLDVYVFTRERYAALDRDYLSKELEKLKLTEFEENIRGLAHDVFSGKELSESQRGMLGYLLASGSDGALGIMEHNSLLRKMGGDSGSNKRRYLLKRVFISGESLQKQYPFFYRHKALYPLLFLYRPVKGAVTHPKGIIDEVKKVIRFKKSEE